MFNTIDTICAVASPSGEGGIAVIRISGEKAIDVLDKVFSAKSGKKAEQLPDRMLTLGTVHDEQNRIIDEAMAVIMRAPHSYTCEDVCELQLHGGRAVCELVLNALRHSGSRLAKPGEFTKRAFLNGRIDLTRAEGVMNIISANTEQAERAAVQQLRGRLFDEANALQDNLTDTIARIEAVLDYPEEDLEDNVSEEIKRIIEGIRSKVKNLIANGQAGQLLYNGARAVIVGQPNVGKSSLMNILLGRERAIVTSIAGTTRDIIEESISVNGIPLRIVDTAGLRQSGDVIEATGVKLAMEAMESADIILHVIDLSEKLTDKDKELLKTTSGKQRILVGNKIDIGQVSEQLKDEINGEELVIISAKDGQGIELLRKKIYGKLSPVVIEDIFVTGLRQIESLENALKSLDLALDGIEKDTDLDCVSIDLKDAWDALGELTGKNLSEDIIDRIFSKFCLGK